MGLELFTLNSSFQPDEPITSYESLLWSERYSTNGDFQLVSAEINKMVKALPLESYVSLRDSIVPMKVEVHKIEEKDDGPDTITITGRTVEACWLELRASVKGVPDDLTGARPLWQMNATKESDAAFQVMRTVLGDEIQYQDAIEVLPQVPASADPVNDPIPQLELILPNDYAVMIWDTAVLYFAGDVVAHSGNLYVARDDAPGANQAKDPSSFPDYWSGGTSSGGALTGSTSTYEIDAADLYSTIKGLIGINHRGLKANRPGPSGSQISIEIYNGADLTGDVQFNANLDQFNLSTYLLSNTGSTNVAYVYGKSGATKVLKTQATEPSGLARRVLLVEQNSEDSADTDETRKNRGLVELYKNNATALFGGEVAQLVSEGYNRDYYLGDILKLVGKFGLSQDVRVAEFIRSEDATGVKAYPTFEAVT